MFKVLIFLVFLSACATPWNNPYPAGWEEHNALFSAFTDRPRHLDPAKAYDEVSLTFIAQIYEAPLQYHYLKRPYTLIPALLVGMPSVEFFDKNGKKLAPNAPIQTIAESRYRLILKENLRFQPHPMFSKTPWNPKMPWENFKENATRAVTANDLAYAIKRLASPAVNSPIAPVMAEHIVGFADFSENLKKNSGLPWKLEDLAMSGLKIIDNQTLEIRIIGKYPQFLYWLAMPFFAPIPFESEAFFSAPNMAQNNLSLDTWPVGTGAYLMLENDANRRILLEKNPNFRDETYPCEGEESDEKNGYLTDCGKALPQIERLVFFREKEAIPYWNRFLQGFYDASGISSDQFDSAVQMDVGRIDLSPALKKKGIRFTESVRTATFYMGINMQDPILGTNKNLRQALNVALSAEEYIAIFLNGRAIVAHSPIPPSFFGYDEADFNPHTHIVKNGKIVRKPIEVARDLMAKAGYPKGRNIKTGEPLVLYLDTTSAGLGSKSQLDWLTRQLGKIGVQLIVRATDFNRFQDKLRRGAAQLFYIGWNADYPDPENFFFLLDSQNSVAKGGDNYTQYKSAAFDALYQKLRNMENTTERLKLIKKAKSVLQNDAPWIFALHPKDYVLTHEWLKNKKPGSVINNGLKYQRVDYKLRAKRQKQWNAPMITPLIILAVLLVLAIIGFFYLQHKTQKRTLLD